MSERTLSLLLDARRAKKQGPTALDRRRRDRLAELVAFARANSPYYRELYQGLPERIDDGKCLPVTDKKKLTARFDDWVTDREVTSEKVRAFVENPDNVGEYFLGKYTVATTSGTTGVRGIFLLDARSMAVTTAVMFRLLSAWLDFRDFARILAGGGRIAMVNAMGGHFASAVAATRMQRRRGRRVKVLPVRMPLADMVAELNQFRPTLLASYASMAALLASEQEAGRLKISPVLVVLSAEGLPPGEYDRVAKAFRSKVRDSYAATECPFLSYRCERGWLHVNSDWVVLEAVDADHHPVPRGQQSHTVLVSNFANRVQPILRYDLGDSVLERPDPCECGDPLPAIRVQGRAADVLTLLDHQGERVTIAPLVFATLMDHLAELELFQILQQSPTSLRLRFRPAIGVEGERAWQAAANAIKNLLTERRLGHITLERAEEPPEWSQGGKFRTVIPLA